MKVSFAPLQLDAIDFLSEETGVNYRFIDFTDPAWFCATKRRDDGTLQGVIACEFKTWFDVHFNTAIADPGFMRAKLLGAIFRTLFSRARRITALIEPTNERAIKNARRLGFVYEGYLRMGIEGDRDALIFGMLPHDCRFLPGMPRPAVLSPFPLHGASHGLQS
jgi:hypothetical protein